MFPSAFEIARDLFAWLSFKIKFKHTTIDHDAFKQKVLLNWKFDHVYKVSKAMCFINCYW